MISKFANSTSMISPSRLMYQQSEMINQINAPQYFQSLVIKTLV